MPTTTTTVTPALYEQGLSYADFLAQASVNLDKFVEYCRTAPLSEDDIGFFKKAAALPQGPAKILALAETWCGDVCRELPTIARIAEATSITLRVFLRDQNPDIMDEFLSNEGRSRAIPVFVFYTNDLRYIAHFTERAAIAHAELAEVINRVKAELPDADRQTFIHEIIGRVLPRFPAWRVEAIREMRELLSSALNMR
jgi:hypothetical protein